MNRKVCRFPFLSGERAAESTPFFKYFKEGYDKNSFILNNFLKLSKLISKLKTNNQNRIYPLNLIMMYSREVLKSRTDFEST